MASSREPQTEAGQALISRALVLNAVGRRAFPWGSKPGNEHDQPLWSGYFGELAYERAALISDVWDRALAIGIASFSNGFCQPARRGDHGSRSSYCSGPTSVGDVAALPEEVLSPATRVVTA